MSRVSHFILCVGLIYLTSCASSPLIPVNLVQTSGVPIEQLGLRKVAPSEVIIKQIPDSVFSSKQGAVQWDSSTTKNGWIPLGYTSYTSEFAPDPGFLRIYAADFNALIVCTSVRFLRRATKTVEVPILSSSGQTVTTSSNSHGSYGYGYGTGSYRGYGTSTTYIPGTTIYAPKQVVCNVYQITNLFYVPKQNVSPTGLKKISDHQALAQSTNKP